MAGETLVTVIGNLTADPELRFTPSGAAVCNFTVASTARTYDKTAQEWKDGETLFLRCAVWREAAENVHETLVKGARVIVSGRLKPRTFETKEGEKRSVIDLDVEEVGPSLKYAVAKVTRRAAASGSGEFSRGTGTGSNNPAAGAAAGAGDWGGTWGGQPPAAGAGPDGWGAGPDAEPAF